MSETLLPLKRKAPLANPLYDRLTLLSRSRFPQHPFLSQNDFLYICAKHPPRHPSDLTHLYSKYFLDEDEEDCEVNDNHQMEQLIKLTEFETKMNDGGDAARLII